MERLLRLMPSVVRGDIDGLFGLFVDNLLQLMLIAVLCPLVCGLPQQLVIGQIILIEATLGILLWIGIMITAQAFQAVPYTHALAVAFGLILALAAGPLPLIEITLRKAALLSFQLHRHLVATCISMG